MRLLEGIDQNIGSFRHVEKDMFVTPFFTKEYCSYLIDEFEKVGFNPREDAEEEVIATWSYDRYLHKISGGNQAALDFLKVVKEYIEPEIIKHWTPAVKGRLWSGYPIPFCTKFSKDTKTSLKLHNDNSIITLFVKLNDSFEGCKTVYPRQGWNSGDLRVGEMIILPGAVTHPHYTEKLKSGKKYSLVGRISILSPRSNEFDDIRNLSLEENI